MFKDVRHGGFTIRIDDGGICQLFLGSMGKPIIFAVEDLPALRKLVGMAEVAADSMPILPYGVKVSEPTH